MSDVAGWLVLGTTLETNDFDKKYNKLKSKLEKQELDLEVKASIADDTKKQLQDLQNEVGKLIQKRKELNKTLESKKSQYATLKAQPTLNEEERYRSSHLFNDIQDLNKEQKALNEEIDSYNSKIEKANNNLTKAEVSYKKQAENVRQTKDEMIQVGNEASKNRFKELENSARNIKNETEGIIKKVAKWGLAIFSVRSAYMFIRQSVSTLSQYNEQMATDIEYIKWALANTLKPIIESIISLAQKLIAYIIYIGKAWGLISQEADFSAKAFEKAKKGISGANKEAKKLQKTLAGFDEMNILQAGNSKTGGGGGGVSLPSTDLGNLGDVEIPSWIKWIAENGELVKNILIGIGEAILGWKLLKWANELGVFAGGIGELATMLKVAGIVAIAIGIATALEGIVKFIGDPSWSNFCVIIEGLSVALMGLSAILIALNASNPLGWITLGISAIGLLVSALGKDETQTLSVKQATEDLKTAQDNLNKATNNYTSALDKNNKMKKQLEEAEKKAKQSGKELYNQVVLGIISFDDMTDTQKELYGKYLDSVEAEEELRKKTIEMQQANDKASAAEQRKAAAVYASTGKFNEYFNALVKGYEEGKISSQKMENAVTNIMRNLDEDTRKTFAENLPTSIKNGFQQTLDEMGRTDLKIKDVSTGITISYKDIASSTKTTFEKDVPNSVQKSINKVDSLTKSIDNLQKKGNVTVSIKTTTSSSSSGSKNAKGAIYYPPRLAMGGIINQPGRGIPLGSAIGGERGAEGVIPLTDSQAMAKLGYEIGRNVTINTTLNNYMNARLMNRELLKTQNEDNFAFNG